MKLVKYKLYVLNKIIPLIKGVRHLFIINLFLSIAVLSRGLLCRCFTNALLKKRSYWENWKPLCPSWQAIVWSILVLSEYSISRIFAITGSETV